MLHLRSRQLAAWASAACRRGVPGAKRARSVSSVAIISQPRPTPPVRCSTRRRIEVEEVPLLVKINSQRRPYSSTPVVSRKRASKGASVDPRHIRSPGIIVDPYTEGGGGEGEDGEESSVSWDLERREYRARFLPVSLRPSPSQAEPPLLRHPQPPRQSSCGPALDLRRRQDPAALSRVSSQRVSSRGAGPVPQVLRGVRGG